MRWKQTEKKELQTKTHQGKPPSASEEITQQSLLRQEALTTYVLDSKATTESL